MMLPVVPFLKLQTSVKLSLVPVIIIVGEIAFWAGTFFVGKELIKKYKSYLNPKRWFKKRDPGSNLPAEKSNEEPLESRNQDY
jgi:hypothetical protein